ncbi:hypothetical protein GCM10027280_53120 [Micromonospora polyrhachis]
MRADWHPSRRAAGAGPREWLWFHLLSMVLSRLTAESGLDRRQPRGEAVSIHEGQSGDTESTCSTTFYGSAPIGWFLDCNPRHVNVKGPERDRNISLSLAGLRAWAVVCGSAPM